MARERDEVGGTSDVTRESAFPYVDSVRTLSGCIRMYPCPDTIQILYSLNYVCVMYSRGGFHHIDATSLGAGGSIRIHLRTITRCAQDQQGVSGYCRWVDPMIRTPYVACTIPGPLDRTLTIRTGLLQGTDEWNPLPPVCQKPTEAQLGL
eukprot:3238338-Prymnesium_polylepis.1